MSTDTVLVCDQVCLQELIRICILLFGLERLCQPPSTTSRHFLHPPPQKKQHQLVCREHFCLPLAQRRAVVRIGVSQVPCLGWLPWLLKDDEDVLHARGAGGGARLTCSPSARKYVPAGRRRECIQWEVSLARLGS